MEDFIFLRMNKICRGHYWLEKLEQTPQGGIRAIKLYRLHLTKHKRLIGDNTAKRRQSGLEPLT